MGWGEGEGEDERESEGSERVGGGELVRWCGCVRGSEGGFEVFILSVVVVSCTWLWLW